MGIPLFSEKKFVLFLTGETGCLFVVVFLMGGTNTTLAHGATHCCLQISMFGTKMALTTLSVVRVRDLSNLSLC